MLSTWLRGWIVKDTDIIILKHCDDEPKTIMIHTVIAKLIGKETKFSLISFFIFKKIKFFISLPNFYPYQFVVIVGKNF